MIEYMLNETRRDEITNRLQTDTAIFVLMMATSAVMLSTFAAVVLQG